MTEATPIDVQVNRSSVGVLSCRFDTLFVNAILVTLKIHLNVMEVLFIPLQTITSLVTKEHERKFHSGRDRKFT